MREHFGVGKTIAAVIPMFADHDGKHLGVQPVNHAVVRYAAAPPALHFQHDPCSLLAPHLPLDGFQVIIHAEHPPFLCSIVPMFPNPVFFILPRKNSGHCLYKF